MDERETRTAQEPIPFPDPAAYAQAQASHRQTQQRAQQSPQQRRRRKNKKTLVLQRRLLVFGIAFGIFLIIFSMGALWGGGRGPKIDEQSITDQLKTLDSLSQTTLHFTNIERFADVDEFYGWDASDYNSFILSYEGSAKAAVDPKGVKVEIKGKTVTVTLPAATVLSTEIAEDSISLVKDGKLESIRLTDLDGFKENQKGVIDAKVTAGQLLFDTSAKAKVSATALTQAFCGEKYDVVIK